MTKLKVALLAIAGAWLLHFLGDQAARRAAQPFEGFATIVWVGDGSTTRSVNTGRKGSATGEIRTWQDGALVQVDGVSEPIMYRANPNTLTSWLHAGDRVRVKYRRGSFLFWQSMDVSKVMP